MRLIVPLEMQDMKGGMLQSVELLLRFLPESIEKVVCAPRESGTIERMKAAGARVVCCRSKTITLDRHAPYRTLTSFISFRREIRRLLTADSVVLTNNIASELICGLGGASNGASRIFVNRANQYRGVSASALRRSLRSCTMCVATSVYQREVLEQNMGVHPERICVIPNGVDFSEVQGVRLAPRPAWHDGKRLHIATIGYPSALKNQELLIRSIGILRQTRPQIAGVIVGSPGCASDQDYMDSLMRLVRELNLEREIVFVPFVEDKKVLFAGVDILASTSVREGFGRTIIEAMAVGCPVVALRAGGPETIIQDGVTGLLVSRNSPEEFAHALNRIINKPALRMQLIENARRECYLRYDAADVALAYASLFREAVGLRAT